MRQREILEHLERAGCRFPEPENGSADPESDTNGAG